MKKRILSILLICCMVFSLSPVSALAENSDMPFTDVKTTDWFYDEVCYAYEHGLMQGTSATTFDPDGTTSRGMIVTILYRLEGEPSFTDANIFTDVVPDSWYEKAVVWANGKGIVEGYGNGKFGPDDPITREQLATIMYRYANYKGYDTAAKADLSDFVDSDKISSYALDAMKWANAEGLINGIGASKLDPQGDAARAQVAAILMRFCEKFETEKTYTVTFDLNYGINRTYTTQDVKNGETAVLPIDPIRSGYTFKGWYKDIAGGSKFDFGTAITADLTLYAHWTKNGGDTPYIPPTPPTPPKPHVHTTYTVTFDVQGHGFAPASQTVAKNGKVAEPIAPTADGYTFGGWYKDAGCTNEWIFDTDTVTANTTLYAKWTAKTWGVIGDFNGWAADVPMTEKESNVFVSPAIELTTSDSFQVRYGAAWDTYYGASEDPDPEPYYVITSGVAVDAMEYGYNLAVPTDGAYTVTLNLNNSTITVTAAPTFKAVYDTTGGANTLTFYYDTVDHSGEGITVYDNLPTAATQATDWGYNGNRGNIKSVVIDSSVANYHGLTSTAYMFDSMMYAENISGAEYLDVSDVTDMTSMFSWFGIISLTDVPNVANWDTSNVTNMRALFSNYGKTAVTTTPNISKWKTSEVTDMSYMFYRYGYSSENLNFTLDLSDWSVASVTSYAGMFEEAGEEADTWSVTIPAKTGNQANDTTHWYIGNGADTEKYIAPASGKTFTVALGTVGEVLATVEGGFPAGDVNTPPSNAWVCGANRAYRSSAILILRNVAAPESTWTYIRFDTTVEVDNGFYKASTDDYVMTFNMVEDKLISFVYETKSETSGDDIYNGTYAPAGSVTSVSLNIEEITLPVGDEDVKLTATVAPENATNKAVTWTSSDESVATVDSSGNVHAVAAGEATITVTTVDGGKTATCAVKVTETKTIAEILATVAGGFPTAANSLSPGANAWVADNGNKCYIHNNILCVLHDGSNIFKACEDLSANAVKSGNDYIYSIGKLTATFLMSNNVLVGITVAGMGTPWDGTYVPAGTAFKAVYDTTNDANTLTFYYDNKDHSGEGITVYDNLPTAATKAADWGYDGKRGEIKSVKIDSSVANYHGLTSTAYMFQVMKNANSISGAEYLDVSNVTDMSLMFQNFGGGSYDSHTTLDSVPNVSNWNTSKVTNMQGMFNSYGNFSDNLTKVPDVSNWNTSNVTNMSSMFQKYGHESQNFNAVPDVSKWNTGKATSMAFMFDQYGYSSADLTEVPDVSGWSTASLTNLSSMFQAYGGLKSGATTVVSNVEFTLDLSGWDLTKLTSGGSLFTLKPKTFNVTIPAKTGEKANDATHWYYGDGTNYIDPATGKEFTVAKTVEDILPDDFPTYISEYEDYWKNNSNEQFTMHKEYDDIGDYLLAGDVSDNRESSKKKLYLNCVLTKVDDNTYTYAESGVTWTFILTAGVLKSVILTGEGPFAGTYAPKS